MIASEEEESGLRALLAGEPVKELVFNPDTDADDAILGSGCSTGFCLGLISALALVFADRYFELGYTARLFTPLGILVFVGSVLILTFFACALLLADREDEFYVFDFQSGSLCLKVKKAEDTSLVKSWPFGDLRKFLLDLPRLSSDSPVAFDKSSLYVLTSGGEQIQLLGPKYPRSFVEKVEQGLSALCGLPTKTSPEPGIKAFAVSCEPTAGAFKPSSNQDLRVVNTRQEEESGLRALLAGVPLRKLLFDPETDADNVRTGRGCLTGSCMAWLFAAGLCFADRHFELGYTSKMPTSLEALTFVACIVTLSAVLSLVFSTSENEFYIFDFEAETLLLKSRNAKEVRQTKSWPFSDLRRFLLDVPEPSGTESVDLDKPILYVVDSKGERIRLLGPTYPRTLMEEVKQGLSVLCGLTRTTSH